MKKRFEKIENYGYGKEHEIKSSLNVREAIDDAMVINYRENDLAILQERVECLSQIVASMIDRMINTGDMTHEDLLKMLDLNNIGEVKYTPIVDDDSV